MRRKTRTLTAVLAACGAAAGLSAGALAQPTVVEISGATLLENFFNKRASTVDYIDVDGDGFARSYPIETNDQVAPFELPLPFPSNQTWSANTHWAVLYSAVGSTNGFQELINFGRSYVTVPGTNTDANVSLRQSVRTAAYYNRYKYWNAGTANDDNDPQFPPGIGLIANTNNPHASPIRGTMDGLFEALYTSTAVASTSPNEGLSDAGGLTVDIAPLDVPTSYAVTQPGTPGPELNPLQAGYGNNGKTAVDPDGSQTASGTRGNKLATLTGGANLSTTVPGVYNAAANTDTIFDTAILFAPIAPVVNFGVNLSQIDLSDLRHLYSAGRLKSGENLMVVTRDSGSGTRNGFNNSMGIDPSWGYGDNVGVRNNSTTNDELGASYLPSNKAGNNRVEPAVFNHRLAVGYVGPERGLESSGENWLSDGKMEILAVRNDIVPFSGTEYSRPTISEVLQSGPDGWIIGGPAALATFGDPKAAAADKGGLGWMEPFQDGTNGQPLDGVYQVGEDFNDRNGNFARDAVEARPGLLNPAMRNPEAAAYINNISRSIDAFVELPGADQTVFTPGELAATSFVLLGAMQLLQNPLDPIDLDTNPAYNATLKSFIETDANNVLENTAYAAFGNSVAPVNALNSRAGKVPRRLASASYSDQSVNANASVDGRYISEGGTDLFRSTNLSLRNLVAGDFNGDGLRNIGDAQDLVLAYRKRHNSGAWTAPAGTGELATLSVSTGQGVAGTDFCIEIAGDFNGDGTFNAFDVRYWADGLAIAVSGPTAGKLDRKAGFTAIDNELFSATGGAQNNFFLTTLATPKLYSPGDSRGNVANSTGRVTPGFQPTGADGYKTLAPDATLINALDIDYVYKQFVTGRGSRTTDGVSNWSNFDEASGFDLSADMDGDLDVDQDDVVELVTVILGTSLGDVNLDGACDATDVAIVNASITTPPATPSWANGDVDGSGAVNGADLAIVNACQPALGACCIGASCTINVDPALCALNGGTFDAGNSCTIIAGSPHSFCCPTNFDRNLVKDVADIFAGLGGYFANDPAMDWDGSGLPVTLSDFFLFFADWFVPCP